MLDRDLRFAEERQCQGIGGRREAPATANNKLG